LKTDQTLPVVMVFAGNDPTGGAGIQADIESLASMGCRAAPVITAITIQDTVDVKGYFPLDMATITEQARTVLEDMPIAAFKIGMLGSVEAIEAIAAILEDYPDHPVIFDPVLASGSGEELADDEMIAAITQLLLPKSTIIVPNSLEARVLAREADVLDACAHELMDAGCEYVLITGSHEPTEKVENVLYGNDRVMDTFSWERLEGSYHGSGCTLASAIAGLIAQGLDPLSAVQEAQEYTYKSLLNSHRIGMGQLLPDRFFWAQTEDEEEDEVDVEENE